MEKKIENRHRMRQGEKQRIVRYADLFCGMGAFHVAFNMNSNKHVRYDCVFACDIDENIRNMYKTNYGLTPEGDINTINMEDIPDFDILCSGFPCQPFSIAGKKKGFNDGVTNCNLLINHND